MSEAPNRVLQRVRPQYLGICTNKRREICRVAFCAASWPATALHGIRNSLAKTATLTACTCAHRAAMHRRLVLVPPDLPSASRGWNEFIVMSVSLQTESNSCRLRTRARTCNRCRSRLSRRRMHRGSHVSACLEAPASDRVALRPTSDTYAARSCACRQGEGANALAQPCLTSEASLTKATFRRGVVQDDKNLVLALLRCVPRPRCKSD